MGPLRSAMAEASKGQALVWRGRLAAAEAVVDEPLPQARKIDDLQALAGPGDRRPLGKAGGGDAEALARAREADRVTCERNGGRWYRGEHLADLAKTAAPDGAWPLAEPLARDEQVDAGTSNAAGTAPALLAEAGGDLARAARLHDQAGRRPGAPPARRRAGPGAAGAGRCLRGLGRPGGGRLESARAVFERPAPAPWRGGRRRAG